MHGGERGDIPGWVMITVMTITVAAVIVQLFVPKVTKLFTDAMDDMHL